MIQYNTKHNLKTKTNAHHPAKHDQDQIHSIIDATPLLQVAFNPPNEPETAVSFPTILPMLGAIGTYPPSAKPHIYLHGSSASRLFQLIDRPLAIAAALLDGYVLALSPFHNSCNYRSAVAFGRGTLVTDPEELLFALELITNNSIPQRWENSRSVPTKTEMTATGVLKVEIETASVKTRLGGADDDRADLRDAKLVRRTWTGVVPTYLVLGEPIAGDLNRVGRVPEYLADWIADANGMAEQRAVDAVEG